MFHTVSEKTTDITAGPGTHWRGNGSPTLLQFSKQTRCVGRATARHLPAVAACLCSHQNKERGFIPHRWALFPFCQRLVLALHHLSPCKQCSRQRNNGGLQELLALVNTTWDTTSPRDGSPRLRAWLPHLLVTRILPWCTMQIAAQMLGIQLNVRTTRSSRTVRAALCYLVGSSPEEVGVSAARQSGEYKQLGTQWTDMFGKKQTKNNLRRKYST